MGWDVVIVHMRFGMVTDCTTEESGYTWFRQGSFVLSNAKVQLGVSTKCILRSLKTP